MSEATRTPESSPRERRGERWKASRKDGVHVLRPIYGTDAGSEGTTATLDSVRHGRTLEHYRAALEVHALSTSKSATTEQMRGAMTHCRTLFDDSVRAQKFSNDLLHPYRYSDLRLLAEHDGRYFVVTRDSDAQVNEIHVIRVRHPDTR